MNRLAASVCPVPIASRFISVSQQRSKAVHGDSTSLSHCPTDRRALSEWLQTDLALNWGSSSFSIFTHFSNYSVKVNNILGDNRRLRHCLCRVENCNEPTRKSSFLPEVLFTDTSYLLVPCIDNLILQNKQKIYKVLKTLLSGSLNRTFNFRTWNTCKQFLTTLPEKPVSRVTIF